MEILKRIFAISVLLCLLALWAYVGVLLVAQQPWCITKALIAALAVFCCGFSVLILDAFSPVFDPLRRMTR